ncbi:Threonylcarbamoyladenosine tRNA methylthiotransferase MtaB [compost metagenome]
MRAGYDFMKAVNYSEMHVFPYSKRTGTPAARMLNQVDEDIKNARVQQLIDLSEEMQLAYARKFVGKTVSVIAERSAKNAPGRSTQHGFSDNYLQVFFGGDDSLQGELCQVKITEAGVNECRGELVSVSRRGLRQIVQ